MSINTSARKVRLIIGGLDWSVAFLEASNWSSSPFSSSGLITTSCTITLISVRGLPGSLDDRKNPLWRTGQAVQIDVTDESTGVLRRHPAGALRIFSAEFNPEDGRLALNCACLLTLLNYRQPTTPDAAEIVPGTKRDRASVVVSLLRAAGITKYDLRYFLPHPLNYPIQINGSYLETVGKLLYSAGFVGWIDNNEVFRIKPVSFSGNPSLTLQIGGDAGDELWWRRLQGVEGPREIIRVAGVYQVIQPPKFPARSNSTRYGTASSVDQALGNNTIILSYTEEEETWDEGSKIRTKTTKTSAPIGLSLPDRDYTDAVGKLALILTEQRNDEWRYETQGEGKLLVVTSQIYKVLGAALAEYVKSQEGRTFIRGEENVFLAETVQTNYTYDSKNRPLSITTLKYEAEGALLAGTDMDWDTYSTLPTNLKLAENTTEAWKEKRPGVWVHTVDSYKTVSRLKPETITSETTINGRSALITDDQATVREESSSGQTIPPAPERHPPKATFEEKQIAGEAQFSQHGGNPYQERDRTFQIEYLEGAEAENRAFAALAQCQRVAQIEGALLYGRFKGQDLGTNLKNEFFGWEPLLRVDCVELDGTQRAFCLDDSHWYLGQEKALCNFGLIWIGDRSGHSHTTVVVTAKAAIFGATEIVVVPLKTNIPAGTTLDLGEISVLVTSDATRGDTILPVQAIEADIALGVEYTYEKQLLVLPYQNVSDYQLSSSTEIDFTHYPYFVSGYKDLLADSIHYSLEPDNFFQYAY